jgi:hypothetical protein
LFANEQKEFLKLLTETLKLESKNKHLNSKFMKSKLFRVYLGLLDVMEKNSSTSFSNELFIDLKKNTLFYETTLSFLLSPYFFQQIISLTISEAYNNLIKENGIISTLDRQELRTDTTDTLNFLFYIKRSSFMYKLRDFFVLSFADLLCNHVYDYINKNEVKYPLDYALINTDIKLIDNSINFMSYINAIINNEKGDYPWYHTSMESSLQLLSILEECFFEERISKTISEISGIKTVLYLILPNKCKEYSTFASHLPAITPPLPLIDLQKTVKKSKTKSIVTFSETTRKSLELGQKKCFKINTTFLNMLKNFDNMTVVELEAFSIYLPILAKLVEQRNLIDGMVERGLKLDTKTLLEIKKIRFKNKNCEEYLINKNKFISNKLNISVDSIIQNNNLFIEKKKLVILLQQRQIFLSICELAEIYQGFPIYFTNSLDYRLRMYPWS